MEACQEGKKKKVAFSFSNLFLALRFYYCMFSSTFPVKIQEAMDAC